MNSPAVSVAMVDGSKLEPLVSKSAGCFGVGEAGLTHAADAAPFATFVDLGLEQLGELGMVGCAVQSGGVGQLTGSAATRASVSTTSGSVIPVSLAAVP